MLNEEGGIDPLEFRFYAMVDRVGTTGVVWLGLTVRCAQCHTHKFDPIPHRDYYRMMGMLNNADETEVDVPDVHLQTRRPRGSPHRRRRGCPSRQLSTRRKGRPREFEKKFAEWDRTESARAVRWTRLHPASVKATLPHLQVLPDDSVLVSGDESKSDRYFVTFDNVPSEITALRLEALPDASLPKHGPGRIFYEGPFGDFQLSEFTATVDGAPVHFKAAAQSFASNPGGAAAAIDGSPLTSWNVNGGQGKSHAAVFIPDKPLRNVKHLSVEMLFEYYYAAGLGHFRISAATTPVVADRQVLPPQIDDLLTIPAKSRTRMQKSSLVPLLCLDRARIGGGSQKDSLSPRCGADAANQPGDVGATGRQSTPYICPQAGRIPPAHRTRRARAAHLVRSGFEKWTA